jgi:hypothetical protein
LPASSCTTRAVAEVLRKSGVVSLHSRRGAGVAVAHRAVDHIEATLPLIQSQFMIGLLGGVSEIDSAPFDVENPIGRRATHRAVNTAEAARIRRAASPTQIVRPLVVPVWVDGVVVGSPWHADVSKRRIRGRELGVAVGRYIDARIRRVVQREWERYCQIGYYIISMIAGVCRACHYAAPYLTYCILRRATR